MGCQFHVTGIMYVRLVRCDVIVLVAVLLIVTSALEGFGSDDDVQLSGQLEGFRTDIDGDDVIIKTRVGTIRGKRRTPDQRLGN